MKAVFTSNSPKTLLTLSYLTIFVTLPPFSHFNAKVRATNSQKIAKICLT